MSFGFVTKLRLDGIRWRRSTATTPSRNSPAGSGRGFGAERNPARVVFFSDALFAITVTVLVLEIKPPADGSRREAGYRDAAAPPGHGHAGAAPAWEPAPAFPG
jgi:hypothetical protein